MRSRIGGVRVRVRMRLGGVDLVVRRFADEVDPEGDQGDAEAGCGVAPLIAQHRVLPPLITALEKLSGGPEWLRH